MSTFQGIKEKWDKSEHNGSLLTKFNTLLTDESEEGVKSCVELLRSFGDEGLCMVLKQEENGQIVLKEDLGIIHRVLWMMEIVSIITDAVSVWKALYKSGAFNDMEVQVLGNVEWSALSKSMQKKVVSFSMSSLEIPAGTFMMGSSDPGAYTENPQHEVTLTKRILVSKYVCTQGLYQSVMGDNPSNFKGSTRPVENVSWCDAVLFCNKLSEMEGLEPAYILPEPFRNNNKWLKQVRWNQNSNGYRLPTEAEWEYAARGGDKYKYSGSNNIDEVGWYIKNSGKETHPVGQKKPNGFGLYDMCGNVVELVWDSSVIEDEHDLTGASLYTSKSRTDPVYVDTSLSTRIARGGSYWHNDWRAHVSMRFWDYGSKRHNNVGFRFLRTL